MSYMNYPNKIFVHCSATDDKQTQIDIRDIDVWHRKRGWDGCGYHYVITKTGVIQRGREDNQRGAHVKGFNTDSIGICLIGMRDFNRLQIASLINLLYNLMIKYNIDSTDLRGHYEVDPNKTCPNIPGELLRILMESEIANQKAGRQPLLVV